MKLPKKIYVIAAVALFIAGGGTALALLPDQKPQEIAIKQVAAVTEPVVQPQAQTAIIQESAPQPVVTPEPTPTPTHEEIKAAARQKLTNMGDNDTQADCFERAIETRYGWANMTTETAEAKITELKQIYVGMCPAYDMYKKRGNDAPGFRN